MFRKKKLIFFVLVIVVVTSLISVSAAAEAKKLQAQAPPTMAALPLLWMAENDVLGSEVDLEVKISPDLNRALLLMDGGQIDLMVTGVNVGAKAFNKGIDLVHMNTSIWAIDYLLTAGFKAEDWSDLKGKTLCLPLKGGPLDFLARYFLLENGIKPSEVDLVYKPLPNGARTFQLGKLDAIILPEPLVTVTMMKAEDAYLSFDLQKEWGKLHQDDERIPFVGLFASGRLAREDEELAEKINKYYQEGVRWVNTHKEEAAALGARYFGMPAPVIKKSFARINLNIYPRGEAFQLIERYFIEILNLYPEMIGGKLPNEFFYF